MYINNYNTRKELLMFTKHILLKPALMQGNCMGLQSHQGNKIANTYVYAYFGVYKFEDTCISVCLIFFFRFSNYEHLINHEKISIELSLEMKRIWKLLKNHFGKSTDEANKVPEKRRQ